MNPTPPADRSMQSAHAPADGVSWLEKLIAHLEMRREAGERVAEVDPETWREFMRSPRQTAARRPAAPHTAGGSTSLASSARLPAVSSDAAATDLSPDKDRAQTAEQRLADIARRIAACRKCPLHRTRTRTVPGQGCARPDILFVGEGPGHDEDLQGLAFVGRAGELLTRMIKAMGLTREEVFIANVVKCRPTVNDAGQRDRPPTPEEAAACLPYLREQIAVLRPRVIITLGSVALEALTGLKGITRLRGQWQSFEGIPLMPTYHPSYLLRSGGADTSRYWEVWKDLVAVLERLGRPPPPRRSAGSGSGRREGAREEGTADA